MKKMFFLVLICMSAQSFAQTCYVDMVDRYNRVVRTFTGWGDSNTCLEGMKECRKTIRLQPHLGGVDCIRDNNRPNPNPNPYPPTPIPTPIRDVRYYLSLSNYQLAQEAQYGIGQCQISRGGWGAQCDYYVKVRGYGYPRPGSGCASSNYTYQYGCNFASQLDNAACIIRIALQNRECL